MRCGGAPARPKVAKGGEKKLKDGFGGRRYTWPVSSRDRSGKNSGRTGTQEAARGEGVYFWL